MLSIFPVRRLEKLRRGPVTASPAATRLRLSPIAKGVSLTSAWATGSRYGEANLRQPATGPRSSGCGASTTARISNRSLGRDRA
jgi:hypothetical protein